MLMVNKKHKFFAKLHDKIAKVGIAREVIIFEDFKQSNRKENYQQGSQPMLLMIMAQD